MRKTLRKALELRKELMGQLRVAARVHKVYFRIEMKLMMVMRGLRPVIILLRWLSSHLVAMLLANLQLHT